MVRKILAIIIRPVGILVTQLIRNFMLPFRLLRLKTSGQSKILAYDSVSNVRLLRWLGAEVGQRVFINAPVTINCPGTMSNFVVQDGVVFNGNNWLDVTAGLTLEDGVSLGPGVIVVTHNRYNKNEFLERYLSHTVGEKEVLIRKGAGIKAGALILMGVTVGENAVVAGNSLVNQNVPDHAFVSGNPAVVLSKMK